MSVDDSRAAAWAQMQAESARRHDQSLKSGGGGGTSDDMEARVTRLEERLDKPTDRVGAVEVNLATLTERVSHLPSKDFIVKTVLGTGAVLAALSVFAPKLQMILGLTH